MHVVYYDTFEGKEILGPPMSQKSVKTLAPVCTKTIVFASPLSHLSLE